MVIELYAAEVLLFVQSALIGDALGAALRAGALAARHGEAWVVLTRFDSRFVGDRGRCRGQAEAGEQQLAAWLGDVGPAVW